MRAVDDVPPVTAAGPDAVRIVPLAVPAPVLRPLATPGPTAAPRLTYRGGPLLTSVEVFLVCWGPGWSTSPLKETATRLDQFLDTVLVGNVTDRLAEYSVPGLQIGHGRRVGRAVVATTDPDAVVTDAALQQMLRDQLRTNPAFPAPTTNTLYLVYLPPGTAVVMGGSRSCQGFCG
jgi:hypothetical protein